MLNIPLSENAALRGVLSIKDIGGWAEIIPIITKQKRKVVIQANGIKITL